jgi:hypothetical protein
MVGHVIEWDPVQVWPSSVPGGQLSPPWLSDGSDATLGLTSTHDSTEHYLNAGFGIPLTRSATPCETGSHHTSSNHSQSGFGCTAAQIVTDLGPGVSHSVEQAQPCVGVGIVSGGYSLAQASPKILAGIQTGVGARRIEGFDLRLNLDGLRPGPDRHRTRPSPLSNICLDHPFAAQLYGPSPSGPSRSNQLVASMLDRSPKESFHPPTPPPRPRAPSPAYRHRLVTDHMRHLARARTASSLGLPQVKPARDSPNRSSSAAMADGHGNSTTNLLRRPVGPGQSRRTLEVKLDCGNCSQPGVKLIFRGAATQRIDFKPLATFTCWRCTAMIRPPGPARTRTTTNTSTPARLRYDQSVSHTIDQMIGMPVLAASPPLPRSSVLTGCLPGKSCNEMTCDCCQLPIGLVRMTSTTAGNSYTTEVVCAHCLSLYKLCSDCGGEGEG